MITITQAQIEGWLSQLFWPFIRIGACFMVAPAFGALFVLIDGWALIMGTLAQSFFR